MIENHFVKSGPSPKTSLCSADIYLNIYVLIKAFKGIQKEEVLAFVNYKELKDNTLQDTQPQQTKDIASFDICNNRHFLNEII